jgi:hypothetical protein
MKRIALLAVALFAVTAVADDKKGSGAPDEKTIMANFEKHATPGEAHKKLEPWVGTWTYEAKFYMAPGAPPMEMKGETKTVWIMGGRFLQEEVTGPEFKGMSIIGYDNNSKKYVATWIDSMSTSIAHMTGEFDASGKVFTWHHTDYDPVFGQKVKMRDVTKIESPDKHLMEFYKTMPDGKEMKSGEIVSTRKK